MKTDLSENKLLQLVLANVAFANVGDAGGLLPSATAGNLYLSLHTADPGELGDQTTNEITYTGYARKSISRAPATWTFDASGFASLAADQAFPASTSNGGTAKFWGIGTSSTGAGQLLFKMPLQPWIQVPSGATPELPAGTRLTED